MVGSPCERRSGRAVVNSNPYNRAAFSQVFKQYSTTCVTSPRSTCQPHSTPRPYGTQAKERKNTDSRNALIHSSRPTFSSDGSTDPCADLSLSEKQQRVGLPTCGLPHQSWAMVLVPSYSPPEQESPTTATLGGGSEMTTTLRTRGSCRSCGSR